MTIQISSKNLYTTSPQGEKATVSARSQSSREAKFFRQSLDEFRTVGEGQVSVALSKVVQKGDTLTSLTRQFLSQTANELTPLSLSRCVEMVGKANGLSDLNRIYVGQVLDFSAIKPNLLRGINQEQEQNEGIGTQSRPLAFPLTITQSAIAPQKNIGAAPRTVVVGDSIALGVGSALLRRQGSTPIYLEGQKHLTQTNAQMSVEATVGLSTPQILYQIKQSANLHHAELAVISAGTNDMVGASANSPQGVERLSQNLRQIRATLNATQNVWILPYDSKARELVGNVAQEFGDKTVDLSQFAKADRFHPKNYADIVNSLNLPSTSSGKPWVSTLSMLQSRVATEP